MILTSALVFSCPYPPVVIAALIMQVVRQTLARTSLLVVCLGYGIVRPKLLFAEWVAIGVVTTLYLTSAISAQVFFIAEYTTTEAVYRMAKSANSVQLPEFIMDVLFLTWIYLAAGSTIRILTEFKQTAKLNMYRGLVSLIGVFVVLFTIVSVMFLLGKAFQLSFEILFMSIKVLNILFLLAMVLIKMRIK